MKVDIVVTKLSADQRRPVVLDPEVITSEFNIMVVVFHIVLSFLGPRKEGR